MDKLIDTLKKGFSTAVTEAGKITRTVADKTGTIVDITKLNIALTDTERKICDINQKIGEMVYEKHLEDTLDSHEFDELLSEIDEFKKEQESLKAQIAELKNSTTCSQCGQNNDKSSEFCSKCGNKLSESKKEDCEDKVIEVTEISEE